MSVAQGVAIDFAQERVLFLVLGWCDRRGLAGEFVLADTGFEHEVVDETDASYRPFYQIRLLTGRVGAEFDRNIPFHGYAGHRFCPWFSMYLRITSMGALPVVSRQKLWLQK